MKTRNCPHCKKTKNITEFYNNKNDYWCKECKKEYIRKYHAYNSDKIKLYKQKYYKENKEKLLSKNKKYYKKNRDHIIQQQKEYQATNFIYVLLKSARNRAKKFGWEYSLSPKDIHVPNICPILGIPIERKIGGPYPNSPSIDRIDSKYGYTPDNIQIISWRANALKSNGTVEEFRKLVSYMEQQ